MPWWLGELQPGAREQTCIAGQGTKVWPLICACPRRKPCDNLNLDVRGIVSRPRTGAEISVNDAHGSHVLGMHGQH
eukprot:15359433-Alexandrium_andersonii.AAC.1